MHFHSITLTFLFVLFFSFSMARDDATFIRYLPFMVKLIPYMFQDGSLSLPNIYLVFCNLCLMCPC